MQPRNSLANAFATACNAHDQINDAAAEIERWSAEQPLSVNAQRQTALIRKLRAVHKALYRLENELTDTFAHEAKAQERRRSRVLGDLRHA